MDTNLTDLHIPEGPTKSYFVTIPDKGTLRGITNFSSQDPHEELNHCFYGVRYARPPLESLRWKKPQPLPNCYTYDGDYTRIRPVCMQEESDSLKRDNPHLKFSEDCLILNIWIPAGTPPEEGWPVQYFIHGGFLQSGTPNLELYVDPRNLQKSDSPARYIVVAVGYRLNAFGFMASSNHLDGANFGHWDIRMGLEWVYKHIKHFGGNPDNITATGLSAGAHSANLQLAYELYHSEVCQIIKRVHLISNAVVYQPKSKEEAQDVFLMFVKNARYSDKNDDLMTKLRAKSGYDLLSYQNDLVYSRFRTVTDNEFVPQSLAKDIYSGRFGQLFNASGRSILIGEVNGEQLSYAEYNPPSGLEKLESALVGIYPKDVSQDLISLYQDKVETDDLLETYGNILSDMQVYSAERILIDALIRGGTPLHRIYRYEIKFRLELLSKINSPGDNKVPHSGDMAIWYRTIFSEKREQEIIDQWLEPVSRFYQTGIITDWGTTTPTGRKVLSETGKILIDENDIRWDSAMKMRDCLRLLYLDYS